jgi:hypothetical protein
MEICEFNPVIYPYRLWVIVDKSPDCIPNEFDSYGGGQILSINTDTRGLEAFTMPVIKKNPQRFGVIIYFRSKKSMTYELVAHESSHAAKYLFEHIGADIKEHEPFEYAIGWIAGCCEKVKKK